MRISISSMDFIELFEPVVQKTLDDYDQKHMNVFLLQTNANEFDYNSLIDRLLDPMIDFTLSRVTKSKFKDSPGGRASKMARQKFRKVNENKGELGELLLYCFLESHLNAPKVLTKYELKTSNNDYVKGSDGVHFLQVDEGEYQLIFCESKTYKNFTNALSDAFESIYYFKNEINKDGEYKAGLAFEKTIISTHLTNESFTDDELEFLKKLIYPSRDKNLEINDAFGIFIGYEITFDPNDKLKPPKRFKEELKEEIRKYMDSNSHRIMDLIKKYNLEGHSFYIYIMPFTEIDKSRKKILKEVLE